MVVAVGRDAGASLGLLVVEDGQDAKDDGDARVELNAHEAMRDSIRNVLKVHGLALDQNANGNNGVESRSRGARVVAGCEGRQIRRGGGEKVAG